MLILISLLLSASPALALDNVQAPFTLTCSGSAGSLRYEQTNDGISYQIDLPEQHYQGFVKHYAESAKTWEQGSAYLIDPAYDPGKLWLSVTAIHGRREWRDAYESCMPTRAIEAPCYKVHHDGELLNRSDEWLNVMVDVTNKAAPKFMQMDLGQSHFYYLGSDPRCELSGGL